jgi:hypothetical protein
MLKRDQDLAKKLQEADSRQSSEIIEKIRQGQVNGSGNPDDARKQLDERRKSLLAGGSPTRPSNVDSFDIFNPSKIKSEFDSFHQRANPVASSSKIGSGEAAREAAMKGAATLQYAKHFDAARAQQDLQAQAPYGRWKTTVKTEVDDRHLGMLRAHEQLAAARGMVWKPQVNPAMNAADAADDALGGNGMATFSSIDEKKHIEKVHLYSLPK